ncbi:hypothetical protein M0805_007244 [Coniferiporia weirii]|nr:hypothetical protein M0805_007244 [Coniferiporia weirii]
MSTEHDRPERLPASPAPDLTVVALRSASSLMGLQLLSRLVTFALNQALIRLASPAVYGTASVQLELLLNTILFLSREGIRNALLRTNDDEKQQKDRAVLVSNIALLPVYFGIQVSVLTSVTYFYYASVATKELPFFNLTVLMYTAAAVLELFSEPMYIKSVQSFDSGVRVRAEGSAVVARSVTTVAVLVYDSYTENKGYFGLMAFALGQLTYAVVLLMGYARKYGNSVSYAFHRSKAEKSPASSSATPFGPGYLLSILKKYFDERLLEVSLALTAQGFVKHILTEGDKIIISRFSPLKDQGGYAVATNYGALVARIFFQPIEETSRLFFSKTLSTYHTNGLDANALHSALSRLGSLLLIYTHFSLFVLCLVPPYLGIVLSVILPTRYLNTSAPALLSAWVWYIPVLAINGVLEAFVSSVASPKDLAKQSQWMAGASVAYIGLAVVLYNAVGLGDSAVVYANIANLVARIFYCFHFVSLAARQNRIKSLSWKEVFPSLPILVCLGIVSVVTRASYQILGIGDVLKEMEGGIPNSKSCILHLGIGVACGLITLIFW